MQVVEFFAGIGGMALALPEGFVLRAASDQDAAAREAHAANHGVPVHPQDLATVTEADLVASGARDAAWLLSPPCQPFTRRGAGRDVDDPRCRGLLRMIELLPALRPRRVLLENVVGFHGSRAHALLVAALRGIDHETRDVEACPSDAGWPVRRPRQFVVSSADGLGEPAATAVLPPGLDAILDPRHDEQPELRVPPAWLERIGRIDAPRLPLPTVTRSYGHSASGGGPIVLGSSGPRFLSPEEILRLHGFPASFALPATRDLRTRWRLAGNSVHVACVREIAALWGAAS